MKEIRIRGKVCSAEQEHEEFYHEWITGSLWKLENEYFIYAYGEWLGVYPESVGLFTGLKDKNGKEIYEGDIVQWEKKN